VELVCRVEIVDAAKLFACLNDIPVYDADTRAKYENTK